MRKITDLSSTAQRYWVDFMSWNTYLVEELGCTTEGKGYRANIKAQIVDELKRSEYPKVPTNELIRWVKAQ